MYLEGSAVGEKHQTLCFTNYSFSSSSCSPSLFKLRHSQDEIDEIGSVLMEVRRLPVLGARDRYM